MSEITPSEGDVRDAWIDFSVDYSNQPLTYDEAKAQYERFLRQVKADALFDYADYLEAAMSAYGDALSVADCDEAERTIEALRARGHQIKEGT
jgi:hypothetical protein